MNKTTLHTKILNLIRDEQKAEADSFIAQYQQGFITSLELAKCLEDLHESELNLLKQLKQIFID